MTQQTQQQHSFTPVLLPLALAANLVLLLLLVIQTRSSEEIRSLNEQDLVVKQKLGSEMPILQAKLAELQRDRSNLESEIKSLAEAKVQAQRTIGEAQVLGSQNERMRQMGKELAAIAQAQQQNTDAQVAVSTTAIKNEAAANTRANIVTKRLGELNTQLPALEAKSHELGLSIQAQERRLASYNAELDAAAAALNTQRRTAVEQASEVEGLNKQLLGLSKEKADWAELTRMKTERAELSARLNALREDMKSAERDARDLESQRTELGKMVAALERRKSELVKAVSELSRSLNAKGTMNDKK